ncbi:acetate--CoA ligase family protein [Paenisporosarcina sp. TG20]|uniref:acetate--CoA ligase family protein n=1 Tax=Paenisporosarcina sp. TG20 TaxID=1211706 RepID=UPI0002EAA1D4|nr:acetate--CoA ligase family protein [Paenisporosarcina sp. TG20]
MNEQTHLLKPMFSPKSIAIIGASGDESKISYKPVSNLREVGYEGEVYLVNSKYEEIAGFPCYKDIQSLPLNIDLALISVNASKVQGLLEELHEKKVKSVVILSSGYSEIGEKGDKLEKELSDFSKTKKIPICGPNSLGLTNFKEKTIVSFSSLKVGEYDPIAFITQSGALGSLTYTLAKEMGLGFQYFVSSGNETSVDFFDYVNYFAEEEEIKVIGGYLEGARDFIKMEKAIEVCKVKSKPLVIMKVGNSVKGAEAASSHTASLAGNAKVYENYLKHNNVVRVSDEEELTDTLNLFTKTKKPKTSGGVAIITQSGGAGIVMADQCELRNIPLAELSKETEEKLIEVLPKFASVKNPIDITAQVNQTPEQILDAVRIVLQEDSVESVVIYIQMTDDRFLPIMSDLSKIAKNADKILVLCWAGIQSSTKEILFKYKDICWVPNPTRTINAVANVMNYYKGLKPVNVGTENSPRITKVNTTKITGIMNEWESKSLLKQYDVPVPNGRIIHSAEDLRNIDIQFPIVMKAVSSDIMHKSDYGLVKLNISSMKEAEEAYREILSNKQKYCDDKKLESILVEEMSPKGIEVIIGAVQDDVFGPCIMFGLGGIFVEVMKDVVVMPTPLTEETALKMVQSIKSFPILEGARSNIKYDISGLVKTLVRISEFCTDKKDYLVEFDINPLIVHKEGLGVTAVDALIVGEHKSENQFSLTTTFEENGYK